MNPLFYAFGFLSFCFGLSGSVISVFENVASGIGFCITSGAMLIAGAIIVKGGYK